MKKFLALILALAMALSLMACGAKESADEGGDDAAAVTAETLKIVLLLPGEINDQGWNASNYAGVVACKDMKTGEQTKLEPAATIYRIKAGLAELEKGAVILEK